MMLDSFGHAVRALWRHRLDQFWPIWTAITALGVILVLCGIPRRRELSRDLSRPQPNGWSLSGKIAFVAFAAFLTCYCVGILYADDFTYYDNSLFTLGTLAGHNMPVFIWPDEGRFFPLFLQEYSLLRHFVSSPFGYHAVRIAQLVLSSLLLVSFDKELSVRTRIALIAIILITPSVVISFNGLIYAEANLIVALVCLAWCLKRFDRTESKAWAVGAVIAVQCMIYYKETAFLLIFGLVVGRLALRCWKADGTGFDAERLRDPGSILDSCFAGLVIAFLFYYLAAMFPNYGGRYAVDSRLPFAQVLGSYAKLDLLAWVLIGVVGARFFLILRGKIVPSLLWDPLAFGASAYIAGYLVLRMESAYYFAPADVIAVLYLGRLAILAWGNAEWRVRSLIAVVLTLVVVQDLSLSAFRMYEAKNVIQAKAEMGRFIQARYESTPGNVRRLFFPFSRATNMMEFGAFLNYRGVPIDEGAVGSGDTRTVMMVGSQIQKSGRCLQSRPLLCYRDDKPESGDLVLTLPDDSAQTAQLQAYRQAGAEPLFSYSPYPPIPESLKPLIDPLKVVSPEFSQNSLPDGFLHASVTVWK